MDKVGGLHISNVQQAMEDKDKDIFHDSVGSIWASTFQEGFEEWLTGHPTKGLQTMQDFITYNEDNRVCCYHCPCILVDPKDVAFSKAYQSVDPQSRLKNMIKWFGEAQDTETWNQHLQAVKNASVTAGFRHMFEEYPSLDVIVSSTNYTSFAALHDYPMVSPSSRQN